MTSKLVFLVCVLLGISTASAQDAVCPNPQVRCWNLIAPVPAMPEGVVRPGIDAVFTTALNDGTGDTVTWAVKAEWLPGAGGTMGANDGGTLLMILELMDGFWTPVYTIDWAFSDVRITAAGGPAQYIANVVQPAVRSWEAARFGGSQPQQPSVATSLLIPRVLQP